MLKCTGLTPNTSLTRNVFGKIYYIRIFFHFVHRNIIIRYSINTHVRKLYQFLFSVGPELFEEDNGNRLMVDEYLLVIGQTNVYAIGDCCNTKVYIYRYLIEITNGNTISYFL